MIQNVKVNNELDLLNIFSGIYELKPTIIVEDIFNINNNL